jgi:hypothetical protein
VDAERGNDIRSQPSALRLQAEVGPVKVKTGKLLVEGEAGGAPQHKDNLIEGGTGDWLRKGLAQYFFQAGAVYITVGP